MPWHLRRSSAVLPRDSPNKLSLKGDQKSSARTLMNNHVANWCKAVHAAHVEECVRRCSALCGVGEWFARNYNLTKLSLRSREMNAASSKWWACGSSRRQNSNANSSLGGNDVINVCIKSVLKLGTNNSRKNYTAECIFTVCSRMIQHLFRLIMTLHTKQKIFKSRTSWTCWKKNRCWQLDMPNYFV